MATYSYSPEKCQDGGVDQMRFELGDTVTDMDAATSALSDEEYAAIIAKHGKNWPMRSTPASMACPTLWQIGTPASSRCGMT